MYLRHVAQTFIASRATASGTEIFISDLRNQGVLLMPGRVEMHVPYIHSWLDILPHRYMPHLLPFSRAALHPVARSPFPVLGVDSHRKRLFMHGAANYTDRPALAAQKALDVLKKCKMRLTRRADEIVFHTRLKYYRGSVSPSI
jgi:hypothetical protein